MKKSLTAFFVLAAMAAMSVASGAAIETIIQAPVFIDQSCEGPECPILGTAGALINLPNGTQVDSTADITGKEGQLGGGVADSYNWTLVYNTDPFFNWTFTSLLPGNYVVNFSIPVAGGPYNFLAHSAGGSITGIPGTTSITGYTVDVEIPNGTPFGAGAFDLSLADTTAVNPLTTNIPVANAIGAIAPISPASMGVTVRWTHVGTGVINLNGGLVLVDSTIPEPATFAVAGIALVGLALLRRRRAA